MKRIFTFLSVGMFTLGFAQEQLSNGQTASNPRIYKNVETVLASCTQNVPSNNFENGSLFIGTGNQSIAADILVNSGEQYKISTIKLNLAGPATYINLVIYSDINGKPGTVLQTLNNVEIANSTVIGANFGYNFYRHTINLPTPILLSNATKFWFEVKSDAFAWENQTLVTVGSKMAFKNNSTSQEWLISSGAEMVYTLEGECGAVLGVDDSSVSKLAFYPNPVKNTIKFAEKVSNVTIFDMTGKSVKSFLTNTDAVDLSSLAKGNYIIQYTTKSGKKVSNKLIKE
ncbi:T9SS type A sorting domain-containing protein [Kaistella carnis]|uniref:T9SS C-terminal target domain-containing protein n=1 Tax=Kaistella carnis TaxID=1241979 RepID=A0A3G8XIV1_9FLAO|nr:T9SS type A sorting domain-containing protein [Kaistella carnis]AZI32969.1 T9SS C-terminal target domain-containing protein [Kaistella carnis]